jgi:hypothetical protein
MKHHATFEDTIVFPTWKKSQSKAKLDDLAEKFEEIEYQKFGKDGFADALARSGGVEQTLGRRIWRTTPHPRRRRGHHT